MDRDLLELVKPGLCYALIPARSGSKTVKNKNIKLFKGFPIMSYSIASASLAKEINRVIVSTDSKEYAEIANRYGGETPFLRPDEISGDKSLDIEFVMHAIQWFAENEGVIPEYLVHLRPTTPIRDPQVIDEAISLIKSDKNATSLRSGHLSIHPPFKWFKKSPGDTYLSALMPGMTCDECNLPRQDFTEVYIPNGYVDVLKTEFVITNDLMHGERMIGYKTDEIPDIDTENDLKKLEMFPAAQESFEQVYNYLQSLGGNQ